MRALVTSEVKRPASPATPGCESRVALEIVGRTLLPKRHTQCGSPSSSPLLRPSPSLSIRQSSTVHQPHVGDRHEVVAKRVAWEAHVGDRHASRCTNRLRQRRNVCESNAEAVRIKKKKARLQTAKIAFVFNISAAPNRLPHGHERVAVWDLVDVLAVRRAGLNEEMKQEKGSRRHAVVHDGDQPPRHNRRCGLLWQVFGEFDNGVFNGAAGSDGRRCASRQHRRPWC